MYTSFGHVDTQFLFLKSTDMFPTTDENNIII